MSEKPPKRWLQLFGVAVNAVLGIALVAILIATGAKYDWFGLLASPAKPLPELPVPAGLQSIKDTPIKGSENARLVVIEYSDFQCPYCRAFSKNILPGLEREYIDTGKVRFAFKHLPLENLHNLAVPAAKGAECAQRQSAFWKVHDELFLRPLVDESSVKKAAASARLDANEFGACMSSSEAEARVRQDVLDARRLGINGTPTFLVGVAASADSVRIVRAFSGARSVADFRAAFDQANATLK